jgi:hypothetical protein
MVLRIKRAKLNLRRTIRQPVGPGIILDDRERLRLRGKLRHPPTAIRFSASFTENIDELLKKGPRTVAGRAGRQTGRIKVRLQAVKRLDQDQALPARFICSRRLCLRHPVFLGLRNDKKRPKLFGRKQPFFVVLLRDGTVVVPSVAKRLYWNPVRFGGAVGHRPIRLNGPISLPVILRPSSK